MIAHVDCTLEENKDLCNDQAVIVHNKHYFIKIESNEKTKPLVNFNFLVQIKNKICIRPYMIDNYL